MTEGNTQEISYSQRLCLSHILRNCEQSLEGVTAAIENNRVKLTAKEIHAALIQIQEKLNHIIEATGKNEFCALSLEECEAVCLYTKCKKDNS